MDTIATQVKELFAKADEDGRKKLQIELRDLQQELETDWDILIRLGSSVSNHFQMIECSLTLPQSMIMVIATIGTDLQLFKLLQESELPLSVAELAEKTGASPRLLGKHLLKCQ